MTSADNPGGQADESFSYDDLGNRTSGGESFDDANRLTSRTGFTYLSDREGRITDRIASNGDTTKFGWGPDGRLRSVTLPDGSVTRMKYDPMGRRIATTRNGNTTLVTYGLDPNAVAEQTGSGPQTRFTFGPGYDSPLASTAAGASLFFEQDALSSVTSLTGQSGAIAGRYSYDTYGQITGHSGVESPYTYTGRQLLADTGVYDYRARWYEPATGRFTSEDPVPGVNLYWYADGVPTVMVDPTGREGTLAEAEATEGLAAEVGRTTLARFMMKNAVKGSGVGGALGFIVSFGKAVACGESIGNALKAGGIGFGRGLVTGAVSGGLAGGSVYLAIKNQSLIQGVFGGIVTYVASSVSGLVYDAATTDLDHNNTEEWRFVDAGGGLAGFVAIEKRALGGEVTASVGSAVLEGCG